MSRPDSPSDTPSGASSAAPRSEETVGADELRRRLRDGGRVLVIGASGYVGGRLVPELLRHGARVRCMTRSPRTFTHADWVADVEVVGGDLLDLDSLRPVMEGVDQIVYLAHSLDTGEGFEEREQRSARNARIAAEEAGVGHVVYLSGLGEDDDDLSAHLRSRHRVGEELAAGSLAVTELRAAVVLGAGSASFEMLRSLVEILPVMIAPRWVTSTRVQPIAIADVLTYLTAALDRRAPEGHRIVEIGCDDVMTYRELMDLYSDVAGLRRRLVVPVPVLTPGLSTHWVNLTTPLPRELSRQLISSLTHDVVVTDDSASVLSSHQPLDARTAISTAIAAIEDLDIPTRWSGLGPEMRAAQPQPWDPGWSGGTVWQDCREQLTDVSPERFQRTVRGIGGTRGWFGFGPLWWLRGLVDQMVGGVGLRRGRRHPDEIAVGEALDFWRVVELEPDLFRLHAEMKVPGDAWLEWATSRTDDGRTRVVQRARFVPKGVWGRLYWSVLVPFHAAIFPTMLRRIVRAAETAGRDDSPVTDVSAA